jgi:hypothetical protein
MPLEFENPLAAAATGGQTSYVRPGALSLLPLITLCQRSLPPAQKMLFSGN